MLQRRGDECKYSHWPPGPPFPRENFDNTSQTARECVYSSGSYVIDLAIMIDRRGRVGQAIPVRREARDFGLR